MKLISRPHYPGLADLIGTTRSQILISVLVEYVNSDSYNLEDYLEISMQNLLITASVSKNKICANLIKLNQLGLILIEDSHTFKSSNKYKPYMRTDKYLELLNPILSARKSSVATTRRLNNLYCALSDNKDIYGALGLERSNHCEIYRYE